MLHSRLLWRVLHRRGGIDHIALERQVCEAMDTDPPPYHSMRSNCVHFAQQLLGPGPNLDPVQVVQSPMTSVRTAQLPTWDPTSPLEPINNCS